LVHARGSAEARLVPRRHDAELGCELLGPLPERGDLDAVDPLAPRAPLHELGLEQAFLELLLEELAARELAELSELPLDLREHLGRQESAQHAPEGAIVLELVSETRRCLVERGEVDGPAHPKMLAAGQASLNWTHEEGSSPSVKSPSISSWTAAAASGSPPSLAQLILSRSASTALPMSEMHRSTSATVDSSQPAKA